MGIDIPCDSDTDSSAEQEDSTSVALPAETLLCQLLEATKYNWFEGDIERDASTCIIESPFLIIILHTSVKCLLR